MLKKMKTMKMMMMMVTLYFSGTMTIGTNEEQQTVN